MRKGLEDTLLALSALAVSYTFNAKMRIDQFASLITEQLSNKNLSELGIKVMTNTPYLSLERLAHAGAFSAGFMAGTEDGYKSWRIMAPSMIAGIANNFYQGRNLEDHAYSIGAMGASYAAGRVLLPFIRMVKGEYDNAKTKTSEEKWYP